MSIPASRTLTDEPDAVLLKLVEHLEKVLDAPPEPVELPHDHEIDLPPAGGIEHPVEGGTRLGRSADALVDVLIRDHPATLRRNLAQLVELEAHVLPVAGRGDPCVDCDAGAGGCCCGSGG